LVVVGGEWSAVVVCGGDGGGVRGWRWWRWRSANARYHVGTNATNAPK
jgi:hypothetical protein